MLARYMLLYLSVCVSQSDRAPKRLNGSSCFWLVSFSSTYPMLCYKEIQVSPQISVLLTETSFQTLVDVEKFRHSNSIVLSTKVVDSRTC